LFSAIPQFSCSVPGPAQARIACTRLSVTAEGKLELHVSATADGKVRKVLHVSATAGSTGSALLLLPFAPFSFLALPFALFPFGIFLSLPFQGSIASL
jgi:hypothetical protein